MKKLFVIFAVASMFVACNKPATSTEQTQDTAIVVTTDTTTTTTVDTVKVDTITGSKIEKK